jgi:hypothetical protein
MERVTADYQIILIAWLGVAEILNLELFRNYLKEHDSASYCGLVALLKMRGDTITPYANDIFGFLDQRGINNAFEQFVQRSTQLRVLQRQFERTGRYPAATTKDVEAIDDEQYKLALLLSFVSTSHRFDVLQGVVKFLRLPCAGPKEILSVGYGTGYELKLIFDEMPDWRAHAYDISLASYRYASELLAFFGYPQCCLRQELFAFESATFLRDFQGRFGKVLLCELLEHLDDPKMALRATRGILHEKGLLFCTMAVNIAQEDHVYVYRSAEQARTELVQCGFEIVEETLAPVAILPFSEAKRAQLFDKGNYICIARPK